MSDVLESNLAYKTLFHKFPCKRESPLLPQQNCLNSLQVVNNSAVFEMEPLISLSGFDTIDMRWRVCINDTKPWNNGVVI